MEVAQFVTRTATEVHGGMGFTDLIGLHYWFKDVVSIDKFLGLQSSCASAAIAQDLTVKTR